jgi:hypothetical protein
MVSTLLIVAVTAAVGTLSVGPAIMRASSPAMDRSSGVPQPQRRSVPTIIASEPGALTATAIGLFAAARLGRRRRQRHSTPLTPDDCPWCASGE